MGTKASRFNDMSWLPVRKCQPLFCKNCKGWVFLLHTKNVALEIRKLGSVDNFSSVVLSFRISLVIVCSFVLNVWL